MQTTLDCPATSSVAIDVEPRNTTLIISDAHIDYLYEHFSSERSIDKQIEKHLAEEEIEKVELLEKDRFNRSYERNEPKPTEYIRVGKKR